MPDEAAEQTATVTTGAEPPVVDEAPAGALDITTETASEGGEAAPEPVVTFDLSTDDGIKAAAESNPRLKGYFEKLQADAANTARQRRDAELRREQGTAERAQQYHEWLVSELQKGTDPQELARQTPIWVSANEQHALSRVSKALLQRAGELGDETARELAESLEGNTEELPRVAQATLDALVKRAKSDAVEAISLDTLPASLKTQVDRLVAEQVEAKVAAELAAHALEQQIAERPTAPDVRGTGPSSTSTQDPDRERLMTTGLPMTDEAARKRVAAALGVPL